MRHVPIGLQLMSIFTPAALNHLSSSAVVFVKVLDINDNVPQLARDYRPFICEGTQAGEVCILRRTDVHDLLYRSFENSRLTFSRPTFSRLTFSSCNMSCCVNALPRRRQLDATMCRRSMNDNLSVFLRNTNGIRFVFSQKCVLCVSLSSFSCSVSSTPTTPSEDTTSTSPWSLRSTSIQTSPSETIKVIFT